MVLFSKSHLFVSLLFFSLSLSAEPPKIIISELYRDPLGTETSLGGGLSHEFIELTNISTDTFYIDSMLITDGTQADSVVPWNTELAGHGQCVFGKNYLLPSQCALILDPDYEAAIAANAACRFNISPGTLILTVNNNDLGDGLQSDDGVLLFKGSKKVISRVLFCASDELWESSTVPTTKIRLTSPPNKEGVSAVPVSFLFDTIVFDNSSNGITPGSFEGLRDLWFAEWKLGEVDTISETILCSLRCVYCGDSAVSSVNWRVSAGNILIEERQALMTSEILALQIVIPLGKGDVTFQIGAKSKWLIDCQMYKAIDSCIYITEIYPKANAGETEWFELFNNSKTSTFNLQHWRFGNNEDMVELVDSRYSLGPGEYVVVCKDESLLKVQYPDVTRKIEPRIWHTLNNYNDTIIVFATNNILVDKIIYDSKNLDGWGNQSIERIDVNGLADDGSRWRVAVSPSPGAPSRSRVFVNKHMETGPTPFTPNGDGRNDLLMIRVPNVYANNITISIYSFDGRKVKEFKGPLQDTYFWDGRKDNGAFAPVGPFFIIAEVVSQGSKVVYKNKGVLWR
jgi:hypothetical protein